MASSSGIKPTVRVQVHIIEARDLSAKDDGGTSDPVVTITVAGQRANTTVMKRTLAAYWDQFFTFDVELTKDELILEDLVLSVYDANTFTRDVLIGAYSLNLAEVHSKPSHELHRQWMALTDAQSPGIQGYLRASIAVLLPGDPLPIHMREEDDDDGESSADLGGSILLPPGLQMEPYEVRIKIFRATDIPIMDKISRKCDPYLLVNIGGLAPVKTAIIKGELNPVWNQEVTLRYFMPTATDSLNFQLFDYDVDGPDEFIAKRSFSLRKLMGKAKKNKDGLMKLGPRWVNFYGPRETDVSFSNMLAAMRKKKPALMETKYCGRVFMSIEILKTYSGEFQVSPEELAQKQLDKEKAPAAAAAPSAEQSSGGGYRASSTGKIEAILSSEIEEHNNFLKATKTTKFKVCMNVFSANEIPGGSGAKVSVACEMAGSSVKSGEVAKNADSSVQWDNRSGSLDLVVSPDLPCILAPGGDRYIVDKAQVPDIIVNVFSRDSRVAFLRLKTKHIMTGMYKTPSWQTLVADPTSKSSSASGEEGPGSLLFSLVAGPADQIQHPEYVRASTERYNIRANIYQARNLLAADDTGSSDPWVRVTVNGKSGRTQHKNQTLFPTWFETIEMKDVDLPPSHLIHFAPPLAIQVFDYDMISSDDLIGRINLTVSDIWTGKYAEPTWCSLFLDNPKNPEGEILISVEITKAADQRPSAVRKSILPEMAPCRIEISTLGLRNLLPLNFLAIQNPHVVYDIGSGAEIMTKNSNSPSGENANILEVIELKCNLPKKALFAPTLSARVYDSRFTGKTLVGTASIPLQPFIESLFKQENIASPSGAAASPVVAAEGIQVQIAGSEASNMDISAVPALAGKKDEIVGFGNASDDLQEQADKLQQQLLPPAENAVIDIPETPQILPLPSPAPIQPIEPPTKWEEFTATVGSTLGSIKKKVVTSVGSMMDVHDPYQRVSIADPQPSPAAPVPSPDASKDITVKSKDPKDNIEAEEPKRSFVPRELEASLSDVPEWSDYSIQRGSVRNLSLPAAFRAIKPSSGDRNVGTLKARITVALDPSPSPIPASSSSASSKDRSSYILQGPTSALQTKYKTRKYVVRVYVMRGRYLVPRSEFDVPDPYILVKAGSAGRKNSEESVASTRDKHLTDTQSPDFYSTLEVECILPGAPPLEVSVMDWNQVMRDDVIGSTKIDLERRVFSPDWQDRNQKNDIPLEYRTIRIPTSAHAQGVLEMFVEIIPKEEASRRAPVNIQPPSPIPYELRMVVWSTSGCTLPGRNMVDIQVESRALWCGDNASLKTDTHPRVDDGNGLFNWRMKYPIVLPRNNRDNNRLLLQIWDREYCHSYNDSLAEVTFNMSAMFKSAFKTKKPFTIADKQVIPMRHPSRPDCKAKITLSMELLPLTDADRVPNAQGREEPNVHPFLPIPDRPSGIVDYWIRRGFILAKKIALIFGIIVLVFFIFFLIYMFKK